MRKAEEKAAKDTAKQEAEPQTGSGTTTEQAPAQK